MAGHGMQVFSDIFMLDNVVQHTGIMVGRNMLIDTLREIFAKDKEWRYVADMWGFPKTPSGVGLSTTAGIEDDLTTRIFIGSTYRYDIAYLPAITIRPTNIAYKPISFNQNRGTIKYGLQKITDGYGNTDILKMPVAIMRAGAWEQTFEVKISTYSAEDTHSITDVVIQSLQGTYRDNLQQNGLFIKRISGGGEVTENISENDPVFHASLSVETYSNWRREIPIANMIDRVLLCFEFDISDQDIPATDMTYKQVIDNVTFNAA